MSGLQKYLEMGVRPQQAELLWSLEERCLKLIIEYLECLKKEGFLGDYELEKLPIEFIQPMAIPYIRIDELENVIDLRYKACGYANLILPSLPYQIGKLLSLKHLQVKGKEERGLISVPDEIGNLKNLTYLELSEGRLKNLPESIGNLKLLEFLILYYNDIQKLPESIISLTNLDYLSLTSNHHISNLEIIENLKNLKTLDLTNTGLTKIPEFIRQLKNLEVLIVKNNGIKELPDWINEMDHLIFLDIRKNTPELHEQVRDNLDAYKNNGKRQVFNCMEWSPAYNYYLY